MRIKYAVAIVGLAATAFALPAAAQMKMPSLSSAYVGGGFGQSQAKDGCTGVGGVGVTCDDKDTAWKIFGGYQFNRNFSGEFGYTDLGEVKASGPGGSAQIKANAWELSAIGAWPLAQQFSIYGRLGGARAETKLSSSSGQSGKKSAINLTFGAGAQYDFTRNLGLRAEWQRYSDVKVRNDTTGVEGKSNVDVLGISVLWRFQ
jgi:OOP family OmpA-OmpF porin